MKKPDSIGVDIDPAFARYAGKSVKLAMAFTAIILLSALFDHAPFWTIALMVVMFVLGAGANAMAFGALTGASIMEVVKTFRLLHKTHVTRKGRIELGDEPEPYIKGQRLKITKGYDHWIGPAPQRFVSEGDTVQVRADSATMTEVYVITDDGAHITVPKRFLESLD